MLWADFGPTPGRQRKAAIQDARLCGVGVVTRRTVGRQRGGGLTGLNRRGQVQRGSDTVDRAGQTCANRGGQRIGRRGKDRWNVGAQVNKRGSVHNTIANANVDLAGFQNADIELGAQIRQHYSIESPVVLFYW